MPQTAATPVTAEIEAKLSRVFSQWRKIAVDACKAGTFGDLQFGLRLRNGVPETQEVTKRETAIM